MEMIIKDKSDFDLVNVIRDDHNSTVIHRETDPVLEPDIVGTEVDTDTSNLVRLLTANGGPAFSVIAIVGMGGIGKTTLAQKIYNHKTIRDSFQMPPPMWVCVSQDYSETNLVKEFIRCAGGHPGEAQTLGELKPMLRRLIEHKKFLLVLDDVWNTQVWERLLRNTILCGATGSRVLITTRDARVARGMGAVYLHNVEPLSLKDGWMLLRKLVFREGEAGIETIEDIGMQIAEKCAGLPLALKTIAGVLRTKEKTQQEWEKVLQNPAWSLTDLPDGVMGVLYLSYKDLPFHLKQCFIYCSLFPEDYVFLRTKLVALWVAEGLVKDREDMIMEDVAEEYYKELLERSLLQRDPTYYDNAACKVHDLLRSLSQFLTRDEIFVGDVKDLAKVTADTTYSTKLRHLSVVDADVEQTEIPEVLEQQTSLRTLSFISSPRLTELPQGLFEKLTRLRVLDFTGTELTEIPESIGNLIHLRFLDLSGSLIRALPQTIQNLHRLQYLILEECKFLHSLPDGVAKLYNLRWLSLINTPVNGMPEGVGELRHLNTLSGFVVNESTGNCSLEKVGSLSQIRRLIIYKLERALMTTKARGFLLKDKKHLQCLELRCEPVRADGEPYGEEEETDKIQEVFEKELCPPPSVQDFMIEGYFGLQFPSWMTSSTNTIASLFNLRRLYLVYCWNCSQLPPLGLLPNLDDLEIEGASSVECIGPEFMGSTSESARWATPSFVPFPKLRYLRFIDMPKWEQWLWEVQNGVVPMPRLQTLNLLDCPKLISLPGFLHSAAALTKVSIKGVPRLSAIENFTFIKELRAYDNTNLRRISDLPALLKLRIGGCPSLEDVRGLDSLQSLRLTDLEMTSLPAWLKRGFPAIESVNIMVGKVDVLHRCLVDGPDWPKIQHFSRVYIQAKSTAYFVSYTKDPFTLNKNIDVVPPRLEDGQSVDPNL